MNPRQSSLRSLESKPAGNGGFCMPHGAAAQILGSIHLMKTWTATMEAMAGRIDASRM